MSISDSIRNLQDYADNPKNGYMDNVFLDLVKQKQRLGKALTEEEAFLDNADTNPNTRRSDDDD